MPIPKYIWSYWSGPDDDIVNLCKKSWVEWLTPGLTGHTNWTINMLNKETLSDWIDLTQLPSTYNRLTPAAQSDIIRLTLLSEYGGIWMDASILLHQNFDWLEKFVSLYSRKRYFQFKIPWYEWTESSFIVVTCVKNESICKWRDLLGQVLEFWPNVQNSPVYRENYTHLPNYFMVYQTYLYLCKHDKDFKGGVVLPMSGVLAIVPIMVPNMIEPRYFTKFIKGGRSVVKYQNKVIFFLIIFFLWKNTKKHKITG